MSSIGKIFAIVNLVLAGLFLGWAVSALNTSNNFKAELDKTTAAMKTMETAKNAQISELSAKEANAKDALGKAIAERDGLKTEAENLKTELSTARRTNESMQGQLSSLDGNVKTYNEKLASLEASKDRAQAEAKDALTKLADAKEALQSRELALRDSNDNLTKSQGEVASLNEKLGASTKQATKNKSLLDQVVSMTGISLADITAQPQIDAAVLGVKMDVKPGLVMLNVGRDSKVSPGMTFHVYSGNTYKGSVRVENVQATMSSAVVTTAVAGTSMTQGDNASTRL